jgi:hypothetical protein
VTPLLNKPDLDSNDLQPYRSIFNLLVILKPLELIVHQEVTEVLFLLHYISAFDIASITVKKQKKRK